MGMPEIQEAPRPSNPWVPMGATVVETGTDALGSLGNRSQGIAFMNGSWMSREVHVQFWERVGVQFPCATHLPIYRQSAILVRETAIELSRATLDGWVMRVGELLRPITAAMGQELLSGSYIQADETTVGVQMHDGRGKNHQAYLWQYSHPTGPVVFDFRLGREREGPKRFLGNFEGLLQSDGYGAYDHIGGPKLVHAACWAHYLESVFIWNEGRGSRLAL